MYRMKWHIAGLLAVALGLLAVGQTDAQRSSPPRGGFPNR
jgi:hypothetical protein